MVFDFLARMFGARVPTGASTGNGPRVVSRLVLGKGPGKGRDRHGVRGEPLDDAEIPSAPARAIDGAEQAHLLDRMRSGDATVARAAFEQVFIAMYAELVVFGTRVLSGVPEGREVAEDLVMDVFRRLWESRDSWKPSDIRVYLFGAVRNAANTYRRDTTRRATLLAAAADPPAMGSRPRMPDALLADDERLAALAHAVATLPERQRLVFTLRREQGLTNAEAARVLGIAVKTVEKELTALIKTLRLAVAGVRGGG